MRIPVLLMVLWCVALALSTIIAVRVLSKELKSKNSAWTQSQYQQREGWGTVNSHANANNLAQVKSAGYSTFKLDFPLKYVYTQGLTLSSYLSTGGPVAPNFIFAKEQIFDSAQLQDIFDRGEPCVMVSNHSDVGEFRLDYDNTDVASQDTVKVANFEITVKKISLDSRNLYEAEVNFPESVSYLFQSCNEESGQDLIQMLPTFDTRSSWGARNPNSL